MLNQPPNVSFFTQRLAAGMRILGNMGMDVGVAGHMTARDPEYPGTLPAPFRLPPSSN